MVHAQDKQEPIRVCVSKLKNSAVQFVTPTWQRDELIKAFERINKSKDVKKGKIAPIQAIPLESTDEPDTDVRDKGCGFVLHTDLVVVQHADDPKIILPPPGTIQVGTTVGGPRAYPGKPKSGSPGIDGDDAERPEHPADYRTATVEYRIRRAGNPETWDSGVVSGDGQLSEERLVSQLMDQVANRVAADFRKPHPPAPH